MVHVADYNTTTYHAVGVIECGLAGAVQIDLYSVSIEGGWK